jgi:hypothetical protein
MSKEQTIKYSLDVGAPREYGQIFSRPHKV